MANTLTFKIFTVDRQLPPLECDYVKLNIADDKNGKFSGSYGIKTGHAKAVFSLSEGTITIYKNNEIILSAETSNGFAMVEDNVVSVTVNYFNEAI